VQLPEPISHFPKMTVSPRRLAVTAERRFMAHFLNGLQQQLAAVPLPPMGHEPGLSSHITRGNCTAGVRL